MYVCMYVCLYACLSVFLSVCLSVCMYVCMYVCISSLFIWLSVEYCHFFPIIPGCAQFCPVQVVLSDWSECSCSSYLSMRKNKVICIWRYCTYEYKYLDVNVGVYFGCPLPVAVTTTIMICFVANPCKPWLYTVTWWGPQPMHIYWCR